MVGRQHQQVVLPHRRNDLGQAAVEEFERRGIAGHVAAMAVFAVEIDEIGHDERALAGHFHGFERAIEELGMPVPFNLWVTPEPA